MWWEMGALPGLQFSSRESNYSAKTVKVEFAVF